MDYSETLRDLLQNNEKNIADLIGQEISQWVLAKQMLDQPELEQQSEIIFLKIYQNTCRTIENLLLYLIHQEDQNLSEEELQNFRSQIQLFTHQLVESKKNDLKEKLAWLRIQL